MTHADDRDEVDRKFAELVGVEFGREVGAVQPDLIESTLNRPTPPAPTSPPPPVDELWFNDDVDYRHPHQPPIQWRPQSAIGLALVVAGGLIGVANLTGLITLGAIRWVSLVLLVTGVAVLMSVALRRNPDPDDEPGAQL